MFNWDNKFAKRIFKWKPKKDIFMAAQKIFKLLKKLNDIRFLLFVQF